jgi:predicted alpha/beta superfamily hydrolase
MTAWQPYRPEAGDPSAVPLLVRRRLLSPELRNFRDLIVALPPSYHSSRQRYPVVYLQDGQNLFDPATAFAGDWHLGPILGELADRGDEAIVIGIPNTGRHRVYEYSPFVDRRHGGGGGDRYLTFLAGTVKPLIDRSFRTLPGPMRTVIGGASMGALISLYAWLRYPDVFGAAAVMSPALWFADRAVLRVAGTGGPRSGRIHLDIGLEEPPSAVADTRSLRDILLEAGMIPGDGFEYVEDEHGRHAEDAWGRRLGRALPFLLGTESRTTTEGGDRAP